MHLKIFFRTQLLQIFWCDAPFLNFNAINVSINTILLLNKRKFVYLSNCTQKAQSGKGSEATVARHKVLIMQQLII
jgi:hypothetical protein